MDILAISGSRRSESSNTALLRAAQALAPPGVCITLYEGLARSLEAQIESEGQP